MNRSRGSYAGFQILLKSHVMLLASSFTSAQVVFMLGSRQGAICFSGISLGLQGHKGLTDLKQPDCLAQGHPAQWAGNFIGRRENRRGKRVLNSWETLNLGMEEMWRRPACRGLFYSLWTQERRGAGSLGRGGEDYKVATGPLLSGISAIWGLGCSH